MILITGGAGFIGSHTYLELVSNGYRPLIVDNLVNSHVECLNRLEKLTGLLSIAFFDDVRDTAALDEIFSTCKIDAVIHFAALKAVGESVSTPLEYYDNNLVSTLSLLKAMKKAGVHNLVFSSSSTVYSQDNQVPLKEDSKTGNCTNPYGWTKYMTEQILRSYCVSDPQMSVVLLRYFNPIGADKSGLIGEDPQGIPNNLMPYITNVAIGKFPYLSIYGNDWDTPDGTGIRDYIHVTDLAKAHVKAVEYAANHKGCEAFNIGTGKGSSVLEIVKTFEEVNGVKIPYRFVPRRPGDLACVYADCTKAKEVLSFETELSLADMCRDSWNWQKKNPKGYQHG